jgi:dipeptidyl-peptidase III
LIDENNTTLDSEQLESEASASLPPSPRPPPFSSLYFAPLTDVEAHQNKATVSESACSSLLATAPAPSFEETLAEDEAEANLKGAVESSPALPGHTRGGSSGKSLDDGEPPPPYSEESIPLESFSYVMAAAGGVASILTQVQQTGGPPINALGGKAHTCQVARRSRVDST